MGSIQQGEKDVNRGIKGVQRRRSERVKTAGTAPQLMVVKTSFVGLIKKVYGNIWETK